MAPAPDYSTNPSDAQRPGGNDGAISLPVDELHRLAQIFDAAADDVDAAVNRLHQDLESTALNRNDPEFSPRRVADDSAMIRASLRPVTAQLRADAGFMAATASETVEADAGPDPVGTDSGVEPSPADVDETAGWVGRVADRLHQPERPSNEHASGADGRGTDPVWDRVSRATGPTSPSAVDQQQLG